MQSSCSRSIPLRTKILENRKKIRANSRLVERVRVRLVQLGLGGTDFSVTHIALESDPSLMLMCGDHLHEYRTQYITVHFVCVCRLSRVLYRSDLGLQIRFCIYSLYMPNLPLLVSHTFGTCLLSRSPGSSWGVTREYFPLSSVVDICNCYRIVVLEIIFGPEFMGTGRYEIRELKSATVSLFSMTRTGICAG